MLVTGHAVFDFIHSNQLVAMQKLVPDELNITMIPNQKDGKPGQYLKPSMLISMARLGGRSGGRREADELLHHRRRRQRHPPDRARRDRATPASASASAERCRTPRRRSSTISTWSATHVGPLPPPPPKNAGELDRALLPAWESVAFKKVDVKQAAKDYYENAKAVLARA